MGYGARRAGAVEGRVRQGSRSKGCEGSQAETQTGLGTCR